MMFIKVTVFVLSVVYCTCLGPFHEESKITIVPDQVAEYFGYSVVLTKFSVIVGAPKAKDRSDPSKATGLVFKCQISDSSLNAMEEMSCNPLKTEGQSNSRNRFYNKEISMKNYQKDDMWFGASMALLENQTIVICAPRYMIPYKDTHMMPHGLCYVKSDNDAAVLDPLKEASRQAFIIDGKRKEFGDYGTHLNFYACGQFGMSVKVTENDHIIVGAPGLLQWTGGIVDYQHRPENIFNKIFLSKQPITNPYNVKELRPDDYFGYTVESGVFGPQKTVLYVVAAPRSKMGYGQVLVFSPATRESEALDVRASIIGPQLGAYFGASLCCTDLNGDGFSDLLVGAPNFFTKNGDLPFDQGSVFVFLNENKGNDFILKVMGQVSGSGASGARFGNTIADLGDIDGDGFTDIAIGAPWENYDKGAVYIYKGCHSGLRNQYLQRITSEHSSGFGISISKGVDLDNNKCNELAIGAYKSGTAYIYKCIPTIVVQASMKVPNMMDLPQNATNFTAIFCVNAAPNSLWPQVKLDLTAKITVDLEERRAILSGDDEYMVVVSPGQLRCEEQTIQVKPTADLSRPISLKFELEVIETNTTKYDASKARLSEDSQMHTSFDMQLTRGCGQDLICRPFLVMNLDYLDPQPYIPGSGSRLGVLLTIWNKEEPAFGAKVLVTLPLPPLRVPKACSLKELNMTCNIPAPLYKEEKVIWEIELQYALNITEETNFTVVADLEDQFYMKNISGAGVKDLVLSVLPQANFSVSGSALLNSTIPVTRLKLIDPGFVNLIHYYEIFNVGPSDWTHLKSEIHFPNEVSLLSSIHGCVRESQMLICEWFAPAKVSLPIALTLQYNFTQYGEILKEKEKINITTAIFIHHFNRTANITSILVLEPTPPIWPSIVGSIVGFLVLAAIIYALYKYGFFSRRERDKLKELQQNPTPEEPSSSTATLALIEENESVQQLIQEDSD